MATVVGMNKAIFFIDLLQRLVVVNITDERGHQTQCG